MEIATRIQTQQGEPRVRDKLAGNKTEQMWKLSKFERFLPASIPRNVRFTEFWINIQNAADEW